MSANPTTTNKCSHFVEAGEVHCSSSSHASSQRGPKRRSVCSVGCQTDNQYLPSAAPLNQPAASVAANPCGSSQESASPTTKVGEQKKTSPSMQKTLPADQDGVGLIKLAIPNFQSISDTICSASTRIRGVPWRIMIMPKQHLVSKKNQKCMGFFLQCCPDKTYSDAWSCKADAEMRLVSQKQGVANFVRKTTHTYTAKENDWGYSCFMTWADIVDETQGYIKDDKIFLEITVKSDFARNMMTREEFCKSIDQWFNLAEMQMSRGLVDLALEANNQALKFCKDRDEEMKKKLDDQKSSLVKKKVLDSIDRLENKKEISKPTEPLKPTSLRQALTGTQKTISTKGAVKTTSKKDRRATLQQMKKKKQDLAAKEKELKQKQGEWDEIQNQLSSISSDEQKNSTSSSPISENERCTCGGTTCLANRRTSERYPSSSASVTNETEEVPPSVAAVPLSRDMIYEPTSPTFSVRDETNKFGFEVHVDAVFPDEEHPKRFQNELALDDALSEDGEDLRLPVSSDVTDDSDDYQEGAYNDEEYADGETNCSLSSGAEEEDIMLQHRLDPDMVSVVECSCQTEESGEALTVPGRQRRPAGSGSTVVDPALPYSEKFMHQLNTLSCASFDVVKDMDCAEPACESNDGMKTVEWRVTSLVKDITGMAQNSLDSIHPEDEFSSMSSVKFGDDHVLCLLSAGICTVQARKVFFQVTGLSDFLAKMHDTEAKDHSMLKKLAPDCVLEASKTVSKSNGRAIVTAVRRKPVSEQNPPRDFEISLDDPCTNSLVSLSDGPESEIEASIRSLLADVDYPRVLQVIAGKLTSLLNNEPTDRKVLPLLVQLFEYSQALSVTGDCLQHAVDRIKSLYRRGMNARAMEAIKISEQQMKEVKEQMAKFEVDAQKAKKLYLQLEAALNEEKTKHNETEVLLNNQLKDCRNQLKKIEKKTKQEENRNATLSAEKLELEDRLKSVRKELDQLKKKSADERNKSKKEKEKDGELIKRLQVEMSDKESEREREKHSMEEKLRESKSKEAKLEKEKKQALQASSAGTERARAAETSLLELQLEVGLNILEKAKMDALTTKVDAEESLKRARTQSEMDVYRKSIIEWQSAIDDIDRLIEKSKTEFSSAVESVSKGVKTLAHFADLKVYPLPVLPKVVKLPPVQVVQPSTPTYHSEPSVNPIIPAIAAGVIGQPRTPRAESRRSNMESASANGYARQSSPAAPIPTVHKILPPPTSSPWSFLDNVSDMFRPNEVVQAAANNGHFDLWNAQEMSYPVQQQNRNVYQQHPSANNWAQHGNWRVPPNHGMAPPNQPMPQMRAPNGMPYYDNQMG